MSKESGIIELEALVPLFIKGKEPDYGEGTYTIGEWTYILDNDELCKFIYDKTYDEHGIIRDPERDYVAWYACFMTFDRAESKIVASYNEFAAMTNVKPARVDDKKKVPPAFKKKSVQYFLDECKLLAGEKTVLVKDLARGVTVLRSPVGGKKLFIQNGCNEPFIPGSSIKGAVRNAVLWKMLSVEPGIKSVFQMYVANNLKKAESFRDNREQKKFAGKFSCEANAYGTSLNAITFSRKNPEYTGKSATGAQQYVDDYNDRWKLASEIHRDLIRIVRISDAKFVPGVSWKEITVKTYNFNGVGFIQRAGQTALEAIGTGSRARFRITIDNDQAEEFFAGHIPPYLQSITALLQTVNEFFSAVARSELDFYGKAVAAGCIHDVKQWYADLFRVPSPEMIKQSALFRLGWGGGMMSKTQFLHLNDEKESLRVRIRNLTNYRPTSIAPQSRCLQAEDINAIQPLGWCTLRYLGTNETEAEAALQLATPTPAGCMRATIIDDRSKPVQIRVEEGNNQNAMTIMPGIALAGLGLKTGSTVFVRLEIMKGRLLKAIYHSKP